MTECYVCHLCLLCITRSGAPPLVPMGQFLITWNQNNCVGLWFNILHIGGGALFYIFLWNKVHLSYGIKVLYLFLASKFALLLMKSFKFTNNNKNS